MVKINGHSDVVGMEEDGEIVFNENTRCYEPVNWQELQTKDIKEMEDDN